MREAFQRSAVSYQPVRNLVAVKESRCNRLLARAARQRIPNVQQYNRAATATERFLSIPLQPTLPAQFPERERADALSRVSFKSSSRSISRATALLIRPSRRNLTAVFRSTPSN